MTSSVTPITSLATDYDAIESAIRETSQGRWFLTCYLERNRSTETRMLLNAIAKLEDAMRENGVVLRDKGKGSVIATLRDAINEARQDMAHMPKSDEGDLYSQPPRQVDFENVPASGAEHLRIIRDAAEGVRSGAQALHSAGVFHGVAQQIAENAQTIERSCVAQEATLLHASRMGALICELEAELISAGEDDGEESIYGKRSLLNRQGVSTDIPDDVVEELSRALAECYEEGEFGGSTGR